MSNDYNVFRYRIYEHLETYIKFKGNYCPPDIRNFDEPDGSLAHECPLCGLEHHNYEPMQFMLDNKTYNTHICKFCEPEIYLVRTANEVSLNILAVSRIDAFVQKGEYPKDALDYANMPNKCIWCNSDIQPGDVEKFPLPIGTCNANYHNVSSCKRCARYAMDDYPNTHLYLDNCYHCKTTYPVTQEEYEFRTANETLSEHMCGDCGLDYGLTHKVSRFEHKNCSSCSKQFVFDKSIVHSKNIHVYNNSTFICSACIENERVAFNLGTGDEEKIRMATARLAKLKGAKYSIHIKDDIHLLIKISSTNNFIFQIIRMYPSHASYDIVYESTIAWKEIEDATSEGVAFTYKFIKENTNGYRPITTGKN